MPLVDIGANLTHASFQADVAEVISRARQVGVARIIVSGTTVEDSRKAVQLSEGSDFLFATAGVHPHHARDCGPDTIPALSRLRDAGVPLAIVSNSENAIMDHTLRQLRPLEFDHVVLAEEVRCYKPDRRPFTRMLDKLSLHPGEVLHVAFGFKYDIGAAQELGLQTAWINRHREPLPDPATVPDHEWRDLWGLAELAELD